MLLTLVVLERSQLLMYLVHLVPQTVPLHAVPVTRLLRVRQLQPQLTDLIVSLVQRALMLQADALHDLVMALLSLMALSLKSILEARDLSKVLGFFEENFVTVLVSLFDFLFGFLG